MKLRFLSMSLYLLLLLILLVANGCQEEVEEITPPPTKEAFNGSSAVSDLIRRVALRDGSYDNIVDEASCISIVLPVTVVANGVEIVIESEQDYYQIEKIFDESESDEDDVDIIFPVTVTLADHTQVTITNEDDFEALVDQCEEGLEDDDIECIDFKYPLELALYDSDNQKSDVITINDDEEFEVFVEQLEDSDYVGFNFPVTLILSTGEEVQAFDNETLESIIESSIDDCDEDDDNDYNDDDVDDSGLLAVLSGSTWEVTYFFTTTDQTSAFEGFQFILQADGSATLTDGSTTYEGSWEASGDSGMLQIELDFDGLPLLDEVGNSWKVVQYSDTQIELESVEPNDGVTAKMTLQRV
ncbi:hypothetical protein JMN32_15340 [Fulvivirga sp. 29W222]|uniref:Lipocalin-like domain-containing protein n=1 Tax=Fulvivirga marina TaxID=2494733 RepID=A0A937KC21_9BACT|nr:hypothetical protein [Fulvivirga marina]MBL6447691.1 hypothetical protein [Fulvivirga marina]